MEPFPREMGTIFGYRAELTIACLLAAALAAPTAQAGTTTQLTNFGSNPKNLPMYLYTPTNVGAKPPILLHLHACHASNGGQSMCSSGNSFAQQADQYGFLMVCPSAVSSDQCWDVHSTADLTHDGTGSDAEGMMSAIDYVIANKNGDANRVYVAGYSSGGMMTQALIGDYPDVFKAGAAFAGVPFGCFAQGSIDSLGWSSTCANGQVTMTGAQWGDLVRAAYPGYTGPRPRIQLWHGSVDTTVAFHNFGEAIKQWTNVLGVSETPTSTENDAIQTGWIRTRYADSAGVVQVEAIQETGKGHGDLVVDPEAGAAIHFLGLDGSSPVADAGATGGSGGSGGAGGSAGGGTGGGSGGAGGSGGRSGSSGGSSGSSGGSSGSSGGRSGSSGGSTGAFGGSSGGAAGGGSSGGSNASSGGSGGSMGGRSAAGGSAAGSIGTGTGGSGGGSAGSSGAAGGSSAAGGAAAGGTGASAGSSGTAAGGATGGSSGAAAGGSSSTGGEGTGGKTSGSGGSTTVTAAGGSASGGSGQAAATSGGCSCDTGARAIGGRHRSGWLLLALGLYWTTRRRRRPSRDMASRGSGGPGISQKR